VRLELFDYPLPAARIAQHPVEPRDAARLLVLERAAGTLSHRRFVDLPALLGPDDLLVFNDTRVLPARLRGRKETGGAVELLLLRRLAPSRWEALVKPGRRLPPGTRLHFGNGALIATVAARHEDGTREVVLEAGGPGGRVEEWKSGGAEAPARSLPLFHSSTLPFGPRADPDTLAAGLGEVPLPPYITERLADPERYLTVYARELGSAAAPTAGLHFTPRVLAAIEQRGVRRAFVTLHVGIATFRPVRTAAIEDHEMHVEHFHVPAATAAAIAGCRGRVVAAGTTTARCLEAAAAGPRQVRPGAGATDLYITPGYRFQVVEALLTTFHMPRSSLLILVSAFAGREPIMRAYHEALAQGYRFLSFGDAMLIR
jgi:S-adenosylmethionine:tRNA ribosyltransferase-isomerase